ncbi:Uncharacterized membrane protein [Thalassobacillus cyri]|uniref:Uncharacterized membrane protein n=1 Tax=Thalassobacillus cyri TaxID=571932 RepID=A0A1H4G6D9_9BACI|nr:DUF2254 domain-containing protein [Thalassobacillus cyri]SEB05193.1 Uncharacterized membrane protein [Thalassobacillus cyri]
MKLYMLKNIKSYLHMSNREKWLLKYSNLWVTPVIYTLLSMILFFITSWADLRMNSGSLVPSMFNPDYTLTRIILSTLTAGLLSLTAFTFYGVLTALTTFSSQFSPRILRNFMLTKKTQNTLGIFIGSFLYVLICLLFLNKEALYFFIPTTATFLAALSLGSFVLFINHIINWLQITNMTIDMKNESINIIKQSLTNELAPYRLDDQNVVDEQMPKTRGNQIAVANSGYLQSINFIDLIREAEKDDIIIKLEYKVDNFVFGYTPLLTYWKMGNGNNEIDEGKYTNMFHVGKKQTELQDIEYSINKFVEIAIRALGNNDPKTASNTIYLLGDLLIDISNNTKFTSSLVDNQQKLRVILKSLYFDDYLHISFAAIRQYSEKNTVITLELLHVLYAIAQGVKERDYDSVWNFVDYTVRGFEQNYLHSIDRKQFYNNLWCIATVTCNESKYYELAQKTMAKVSDQDDLEETEKYIKEDL